MGEQEYALLGALMVAGEHGIALGEFARLGLTGVGYLVVSLREQGYRIKTVRYVRGRSLAYVWEDWA